MKKPVAALIKDLRSGERLQAMEEASIKQGVVLRLLSYLGWDIFNVEEVSPDFTAGKSTVSFALQTDSACRMLLDVKRLRKAPGDPPPVVAAGGLAGVELAVHTDGRQWAFYLVSEPGEGEKKRCHTIDLFEQKPEQAAQDFINLMSREKVAGDGYLEAARAFRLEQRQRLAAEALAEAWNATVSSPDKALVKILGEATERICGFKAEPRTVEAFLRGHLARWLLAPDEGALPAPAGEHAPPEIAAPAAAPAGTPVRAKRPENIAAKPVQSFSLKGLTFAVKSWEEMLPALCNHFAVSHPHEFEKVLWMYDDHRQCFSRYADQLKIPEKIKKTNIFVETKLSPDDVLKTVGDLLTEFGYGHEDLVITTN